MGAPSTVCSQTFSSRQAIPLAQAREASQLMEPPSRMSSTPASSSAAGEPSGRLQPGTKRTSALAT